MTDKQPSEFSERELEILRLVATGASNKEIAQQLFISTNTVKVHLKKIFSKAGLTSRTEAAMYAVRMGLSNAAQEIVPVSDEAEQLELAAPGGAEVLVVDSETIVPISAISIEAQESSARIKLVVPSQIQLLVAAVVLVLLLGLGRGIAREFTSSQTDIMPAVIPTDVPRWFENAKMPTARQGLAVAAYEGDFYAIGGNTPEGVTGIVEGYSPNSKRWTAHGFKPVPVTDARAAVVGGLIFIPGGRDSSNAPTKVMEVFDPTLKRWEQRASLPVAVSAYALAAYEGRLYLFGGWDGKEYLNSVYEYDPSRDEWTGLTPMPTGRAFSAAVVAGGKIHVIGGQNDSGYVSAHETYFPDRETGTISPWRESEPLPVSRAGMGVASVADIIYVFGGESSSGGPLNPLQMLPQEERWISFEQPDLQSWSHFGITSSGPYIYILGGVLENQISDRNLSYQAILTVIIPLVR
jgi:DNA-binding CsgD family transcriptional regulator